MTKIFRKCILFLALYCAMLLYSINSAAQDSVTMRDLSERVSSIERYNKEILNEKFENKSTELTNQINYEVNKAKDEVKDELWVIKITGGVIALLLAAGIGVLLYKYFVGLEKLADRLLKKKLESHLAENSQYIIEMITSHKTENLIKRNKKLLVICGNETEKTTSEQLLQAMGFRHLQFLTSTNVEQLPDADLIIFSNRNETLPEPIIIDYLLQSGSDNNFIFYGKRLNVDPQSDYADRINFANSRFTLYHQIINTLSFKEIFINQ